MFIDNEGYLNLAAFLLSSGGSVDIVANSIDNLLGERLVDITNIIDSRLKLRCIIKGPLNKNQEIVKIIGDNGWNIRIVNTEASADMIICDSEYFVVSTNTSPTNRFHYSDDRKDCKEVQQYFEYLWDKSTDILYEDLLKNLIPSIQSELFTTSSEYWESLFSELIRTPTKIYELSPRKFEELVAEMLLRDGCSVTLTPETRDGGRDILAANMSSLGEHLFLVECKRYAPNNPVGVSLVRALYGIVEEEKASAGLLITTSYFTKEAFNFRDRIEHRMSFKDYSNLNEWIKTFKKIDY